VGRDLMRVWLDTDIGSDVDDALALGYVIGHPDLELVGLSTVFGDLAVRTEIAERLLAIAGHEPIAVVRGLGVPLTPRKRGVMFGHEGFGLLDDPAPELRVSEEAGADERIAELATAMTAAEPDVVIAIGPLTNVAALVEAGHRLPPLAIMGGKLSDVMLPSMTDMIPEWNWFCDPLAVQRVLAAELVTPPLVVPAEVTFRTELTPADISSIGSSGPLGVTLADQCGRWLDLQRKTFGRAEPTVALHDPLTTALVAVPDLCPTAARTIAVVEAGATELRPPSDPDATEVRAAIDVDPDSVRGHIVEHLLAATAQRS